ncbi:MAG: hypothetical protein ACRD8O_11340 [Bryobacteraceae bacterium]
MIRRFVLFVLVGGSVASADTFLIRSTNGGRTWTDVDPGPPHEFLEWIRVDPATSNLYAFSRTGVRGQLLVSTDRGQTWQARQSFAARIQDGTGLLTALPWNFRAAAIPDTLYLAQEDAGLYPQTPVVIYKVTGAGNIVEQYPAQGLTIEPGANYAQASLMDLAADPVESSVLYALITNNGDGFSAFQTLWRSENGGRSWRRLESPANASCFDPEFRIDASGSRMYLSCGSDFFKSTDRGDSWTRTRGPDGEGIRNLEIGPEDPGTLYGIRSGEVWKSTDAAETWRRAASLPGVRRLQAHPTSSSVIFAVGSNGIQKSEDGGETWTTLLAARLEDADLLGIRVDPRVPDVLYGVSLQRLELRLHDRQTFLRNLVGEKHVAPGSLVSIYGQDLASETRTAVSTPLPLSLGGASVRFNGRPAPLLFASPGQINAQVPFGLTGAVSVEVRRADGTVDRQTKNLVLRWVVILRENSNRQAAPLLFHASDFRRVTANDPARRGEAITLWAAGMGELRPSIPSGELPPNPPPQLRDPPCVVFSERPASRPLASADPLWAGAAPGMIGVYQVNFEIPASLSAASYTLALTNRLLRPPFNGECSVPFQGSPLDSITLEVQ